MRVSSNSKPLAFVIFVERMPLERTAGLGWLRLLLCNLLLLAALPLVVCAQYQVKSWTTDDGLPQNTVSSIAQTPDGYLWLATLDGLVRFDGVRFAVFNKNNSPGIANNRLTKMVVDQQGALWVGNEIGGVTRFADNRFQTFLINPNSRAPVFNLILGQTGALTVTTDETKVAWNGTAFAPLAKLPREAGKSTVYRTRADVLLYSDEQTLHLVENNQNTEFKLPFKSGDRVSGIVEDARGRIWIGSLDSGLFVLENGRIATFDFGGMTKRGHLMPQFADRAGSVWISGDDGAFEIRADGEITRITTAQNLSSDQTTAIFADRENNVWIGTLRGGLNRASRQSIRFYGAKDGLAADVVHPILQTRSGDVWLGGDGLSVFRSGNFARVRKPTDLINAATALFEDSLGRLWIGHWGGVYYIENNVPVRIPDLLGLSPAVYDIHETANGAMWFATDAGVFRLENNRFTRFTTADGLASDDAKIFLETRAGNLLVGAYGGLSRFENNGFRALNVADSLANSSIRALHEDRDGALWIGTYDNGLMRLKNGKITDYTTGDGLFNDGVFRILEDDNDNFWMSSNRGIYRVAKQQLNDFADGKINRIESTAYNTADGLEETECNGGQQPAGIKAADGKLWFPTQKGVAIIDSRELNKNPIPPPVVIESVKIDNQELNDFDSAVRSSQSAIVIAPGKNNLQIDYTGLSFVKPELVSFRYKLNGLDRDWVEAGTRRAANYSYLPAGEYEFQVVAANADGVRNNAGATLKITVVPPIYRTGWFAVLSFAAIGAALYLAYRRRINRLEAHRKTGEKFARDLLRSQETERQRIAHELHDGLGQTLLVIKNRALLGALAPDDRIESKEQFDEISRVSSRAIEEVREIARNLRPYHLDRLGLTQSITAMLDQVKDSTKIEFAYDVMLLDNVFAKDEEVIVYRIVQESINNIVKHSGATRAGVLIYQSANGVTVTIEDNGRGFISNAPNQSNAGFGLAGIEERVRILGGWLQIRSEPGEGTTIIIKELAKAVVSD